MVRTVRADLEVKGTAEAEAGLTGVGAAAEHTSEKIEDIDEKLNKIPADAAKAAASMGLLGTVAGEVGTKSDIFGRQIPTALTVLDSRIKTSAANVRLLADEFNRTGNVDVFKNLGDNQRTLTSLTRMRKDLVVSMGASGDEGGKSFLQHFQNIGPDMGRFFGARVLGPFTMGTLTATLAAAIPMINGLLLGALPIGGIVTGLVGQFNDPKVHAAIQQLGKDLKTALADSTKDFQAPIIEGAQLLGRALTQALGTIDFGPLAKDLLILVEAFSQMVNNIMPGFNKALAAGQPVFERLAELIPLLGSAISVFFEEISMGGKGAKEGLTLLMFLFTGLLVILGGILLAGSKLLEWVTSFTLKVLEFFAKGAGAFKGIETGLKAMIEALKLFSGEGEDKAGGFGRALNALGGNAQLTSDDIKKLIATVGDMPATMDNAAAAITSFIINTSLAFDRAYIGYHSALLKLKQGLKDTKNDISNNTEAGLQNRMMIMDVVAANLAFYNAQVAAGDSAVDAAAHYKTNMDSLYGVLHAAHLTDDQIANLIGKYRDVPSMVNTKIATEGLEEAINGLADVIREVNGIPNQKTIYIDTVNRIDTNMGHPRWGGIYQHADEGLVSAGIYSSQNPARYAFAEPATGGEAFVPRLGDYHRSTAILDAASRWYGGRFMAGSMGGNQVMGGGRGGNYTLQVAATFVLPSGEVSHRQLITYALNSGRTPAQLFPDSYR